MSVTGKVIVITGSTRGIGRAVAEECARRGASVVVCGRTGEAVSRTLADLPARPEAPACGIAADVADYAAMEALRDEALARFGRIDVWFNNAGVSSGHRPLDEVDPAELGRLVDINLTGHLYGCRAIVPYFREHGGYLMNMTGRGYDLSGPAYSAPYAATKAAIVSLTRSLAKENRDIKEMSVNCLVPGMVPTDFYVDMPVSPRLSGSAWKLALDALGVPLEEVGRKTADLLGQAPGQHTGKVYSLITPGKRLSATAKFAWWGMTGKMRAE